MIPIDSVYYIISSYFWAQTTRLRLSIRRAILLVLSFLLHFSVRWGGVHFHCFCQPIWRDQMVLHQPHWPPHDLEAWSETKSATWGKVLGGFRPFSLPLFKHEVLVLAKLSKRDVALLSEAAASLGVGRRPDDHVILLVRKREDEQTRWPRGGLPSGLAVAFSGVLTNVRGQNGLIGSLGVQGHLKFLNMFLNTFPLINPPFGETSVFFFNFCVPLKQVQGQEKASWLTGVCTTGIKWTPNEGKKHCSFGDARTFL